MTILEKGALVVNNQGCEARVLRLEGKGKVIIRFEDEPNYEGCYYTHHVKLGRFKNPYRKSVFGVGCWGLGDVENTQGVGLSKVGAVWYSMLSRCYGGSKEAYRDCSVHPDWHNFQVFAEWYNKQNQAGESFELDKDFRVLGNRVYSESTCCLIPRKLNQVMVGSLKSKNGLPVGVGRVPSGKYKSSFRVDGKTKNLGVFDSVEAAQKAYREGKAEHMLKMVESYKQVIREPLYREMVESILEFEGVGI